MIAIDFYCNGIMIDIPDSSLGSRSGPSALLCTNAPMPLPTSSCHCFSLLIIPACCFAPGLTFRQGRCRRGGREGGGAVDVSVITQSAVWIQSH